MDVRQHSPASERNKGPILSVLRRVLPPRGTALEIASGTGQHVVHFAAALPDWTWQPSDVSDDALASITAWTMHCGLANVRTPLRLDVTATRWPVGTVDAVFCANMLHISRWAACAGLVSGAARHLSAQGLLVTYGPYLVEGEPTAASNLAFDAELRARDPEWGLRRLGDVVREAAAAGLALQQRVSMPAHNVMLVFRRAEAD